MQGHTLDLMSLGFPITNIEVRDAGLSDHLPIIFDCSIAVLKSESRPSTYLSRVINSSTTVQFTKVFAELSAGVTAQFSNVDGLVDSFNTSYTGILNEIAPLKVRKLKSRNQPWINREVCVLRKECRTAERKWRKDKLQISSVIAKFSGQISRDSCLAKV